VDSHVINYVANIVKSNDRGANSLALGLELSDFQLEELVSTCPQLTAPYSVQDPSLFFEDL